MKKVLLILCVLVAYTVQAQVDTIRWKVPYWHYNFYDSTWCQSQVNQGQLYHIYPVNTIVNKVGTARVNVNGIPIWGRGIMICGYCDESPEVAIRMDRDTASEISGIVFGYNNHDFHGVSDEDPGHIYACGAELLYYTNDYIFNIYDKWMGLIWSDTVETEDLKVDCCMEAGFDWRYAMTSYDYYYPHQQGGYEAPCYINLCKVYFDTIIQVPDTFYIGLTSTTPINTYHDTMLMVTALYETYYTHGHDNLYSFPYESRRYRIAPGKGDSIQYWAEEECHYGVQTCLYPILALPCGEVTNLRCHTIGSAGIVAYVEWDAGVNDSAYEVSYGPEGTPAGEGTVFETTIPQFVHALDRNTHYDFYVRARCDLDTTVWTAWSEPLHVHLASMTINDAKEPFEWSLTPNPAHGSATVQCDVGITSVELLTVKGERVMLREIAGEQTCTLDLTGLARGIYIVQVTTPQGTAARKLAVE